MNLGTFILNSIIYLEFINNMLKRVFVYTFYLCDVHKIASTKVFFKQDNFHIFISVTFIVSKKIHVTKNEKSPNRKRAICSS